ncbi:MAG TPA: hypothetical protein VF940_34585, partial [Streptosporangiaceae bacterium]
MAGGKGCALASRVEPCDDADTAAMLDRHSTAELIVFARRLDPRLCARDFADAERQLDQIDEAFTRYGLSAMSRSSGTVRRLAQDTRAAANQILVRGRQGRLSEREPSRQAELPTGSGVVSHAGLMLIRALSDAIGLTAGLSRALASDRLVVHDRGRVLADLACAIADGGEA